MTPATRDTAASPDAGPGVGVIDSHTHLDSLDDAEAGIAAARAAGLVGVVSIGCGLESIRATLAIAERHVDLVRVAVGIHPASAARWDRSEWPQVEELARHPQVCAIGETGLDQFRDDGTIEQQLPAFELQAALARELDLPLVIHTRAAERATLDALDRFAADLRVVLHCFSLADDLDEVLAHERWTCSFAGNVTYGSAGNLREAAARIPAGRIMVETDAPYLSPKPHRGQRNQPAYVQHTLAVVAQARGMEVADLAAETTRTASELFGFAPGAVVAGGPG